MSLSLFFFGSVTFYVPSEYRLIVLNLCLISGIPYRDFTWEKDGGISFSLPMYKARQLRRICQPYGITLVVRRRSGLPAIGLFFLRRLGLLTGLLCACVLLFFSTRFVWRMEIKGNESLSTSAVAEMLRGCDLGVGSYIPGINTRQAENRVLMSCPQLSWISLRLDGTVLSVQIIEKDEHSGESLPPPSAAPANLVASCDGQIERIEVFRGQTVVKHGQAVKQGELLVSGIYDSNAIGYRYTRAAGHIWARTEREYCIRMPLNYTEKICSESAPFSRTLRFFNFSLNFFQNTGNYSESCDIIKKETEFHTPGGLLLPISLISEDVNTYTEETRTRTAEAALALCYTELDRVLSEALSDAELLQKDIQTEMTDTEVILRVKITALEDIARQIPFEVVE